MSATALNADFAHAGGDLAERKWSRRQTALFLVGSSSALWALILYGLSALF